MSAHGSDAPRLPFSFTKLAEVHRGWCNYCKGNVEWCHAAPPEGCALRDCEAEIASPPQGSGETLETLIYPTRHRSAFSVEVVVATEAQAHALRDALTAASAQSAAGAVAWRYRYKTSDELGDWLFDVEPLYARPAPPAVPEGMVMVPREPTIEMENAGDKADRDFSNNCFHGLGHLGRVAFVYHYMLSASPRAKEGA